MPFSRVAPDGDRRQSAPPISARPWYERQSQFELGNDPDLLPPFLEFLQDEMIQLDRWDSAEVMRTDHRSGRGNEKCTVSRQS